jgi:hypothetical protein
MVEPVQEAVEDLLPTELALAAGVVALGLQGGPELDGGDEAGAAFADGLEVAVGFNGSGSVAVAEHPAVQLLAEFAHLAALVVAGQLAGLVIVQPAEPQDELHHHVGRHPARSRPRGWCVKSAPRDLGYGC